MNIFYLNDCLGGKSFECSELAAGMVMVVKAFSYIANNSKLAVDKGWVLEKDPVNMKLGGVALQKIVNNMRDRDCRRLFYIYSIHHPIHNYFHTTDDELLLEADYKFCGADATNIAIACQNSGILLSLPVSDELRVNMLSIIPKKEGYKKMTISNMHGEGGENIKYIERVLLDRNYQVANGLAKLECLAPHVCFSSVFKDGFANLTSNDIKSIFDRIDEARKAGMLQPLVCNGTIIKHVAPHVAELRIVNPVDIRVYFHELDDIIYFAKVEFKSTYKNRNDQDADIEYAERIVEGMMK